MKGTEMDIDWRLVQIFLGEDGIAEVELDSENSKKVRCNCKSFSSSGRCKHVKHVKKLMEDNNGHYSIQIPVDIPDEEAFVAMNDPASFRDFIMKYGKIEVID